MAAEKVDYRYENGRRFHGFHEGAYYMPNDEVEVSRLGMLSNYPPRPCLSAELLKDTQHQIWLVTLDNALFRAPVGGNKPISVLDVGTGSGIWALECASRFPDSHVLGIDLSPVKPNYPVPANCIFRVHDAETEWEFGDVGPFDLIHARMLVLGMHDWRAYFRRCYDHLKPGGWMEVHEIAFPMHSVDPSVPSDTPYLRWSQLMHEGLAKGGIDGGAARDFTGMLEEAGFEEVVEEIIPWAVGPWPQDEKAKRLGVMEETNLRDGLQGFTMGVLTKNLGWTSEEVDRFVEEIKKDIDDPTKQYEMDM
ncbi:MAG: hypothetical protein Q9193_000459 [Seirophora villosa]